RPTIFSNLHPTIGASDVKYVTIVAIAIAGIMSLGALAIDAMLPALDIIARDLGLEDLARQQYVILAFFLGLGVTQIFIGPLSDRFGRRKLLLLSLALYTLCALAAAAAPNFDLLLLARALQGAAAAGGRILVNAIVRDLYEGRTMARIISLAQIAFVTVPVVAPLVGAAVLLVSTWRGIFLFIAALGGIYWLWIALRLPETQDSHYRGQRWQSALIIALRDKRLIGFSLAAGLCFISLVVYLGNVAQIFTRVYGRPDLIATGFALVAVPMGISAYFNARLVMRFGMGRLVLVAICVLTVTSGAMVAASSMMAIPLAAFLMCQAIILSCSTVIQGNLTALALEKLGAIAGMASSLYGSISTLVSVVGAGLIGSLFQLRLPVYYAGIATAAVLSLAIILYLRPKRGRTRRPETET
ncbi:MAG: MFS transporter, partial [Pseudomonadota bacterium]